MTEPPAATRGYSKSSSRWITLAACFLVVTITNGAGLSFGVFLNPFRESFSATSAAVSGAYSITLWVFAFCGVVSGWAVDTYGPRITVMVGALILGSGYLLTGFVESLWQLYLTCALIGIGLSSGYVPTMTTISRTFVKRRGFALGLNSAGIGFGPLIMAPFQTHLILLRGWRFAYRVTACIVGITIPVALLLKKHPKNQGEGSENRAVTPFSTLRKMTWVFTSRAFWLFCLLFLAIGVSVQTVMAHIVAYAQTQGETPMIAAAVLSSVTGASMIGRIFMGTASDWIGRQKALVLCTFFEGLMLLWLMAASSTWSLIIFGLIFGFFYGGHAPQLPALIGETLGFENMGAILGVINLFWGIGSAIGPLATGYLFDVTGSYRGGFMIATALMFTASATGLFLGPSKTSE
ncbi:MAG: MFS transporter [Pseudomonadota bacterium]